MILIFDAAAIAGSRIPDSPHFKAAFAVVTAVYIISMIVIFLLLRRSLKKLPKEPEYKEKNSEEPENIRNKQHTHHQA